MASRSCQEVGDERERGIHEVDVELRVDPRQSRPSFRPAGPRSSAVSTVTQTRPPATTTPCGLPPTGIVVVALAFDGSMRVTVPSPLFATQTEPSPTATPAGARPTGIVVVTALVLGSIRTTALSRASATQTPPAPTAIAAGPMTDRDRRQQRPSDRPA